MTTTFLLVRHASHERIGRVLCGRKPGVVLGERGLAEAARLGRRLRELEPAAIYSSPLERAWQTAEAIGGMLTLPVTRLDELIEIDFGEWTGLGFDELQPRQDWRRWNDARLHSRPPNGESMLEAQARIARALDELRRSHPDRSLVLVSHGDVIKAALAHALGLSLDFHLRFEIEPASLNVLVAGDWGMKVHAMNEVAR